MSKPVVLSIDEWNPTAIKFMAPKVNDRGGKSISIISTATNRTLCFTTPPMMTWGVSDFVDEKTGESDGKYTITLNFPNSDYASPSTTKFLEKLKQFEEAIITEAVKNSVTWWGGKPMSREILSFNLFSFLKYSKSKDNNQEIDYSRPPSIRAKVPHFDNKWNVEIYDVNSNLIFPGAPTDLRTPIDLIPKLSSVACVLQCGGIWIGGKGWGLTWRLVQCVVKPREVVSLFGKCHIKLSNEERDTIENDKVPDTDDTDELAKIADAPPQPGASAEPVSTHVDDSDDEQQAEPEPVAAAAAPAPVFKKVVKKAAEPAPVEETPAPAAAAAAPTVVKKKVVKKAA